MTMEKSDMGLNLFWPNNISLYNKCTLYASEDEFMWLFDAYTVKPVLSNHSKIDKTNGLKTYVSLMKVQSIAKRAFCNTFDLH